MRKEELYYDSRDEVSQIHAVRWIPDDKPRAIFQIIHGMQEYADRYNDFATYLAEQGYLVIANDHLGHGLSSTRENYGYFCHLDPKTVVVRDVHRLKKMTQEQYPGIPIILLGHSMGSFILRNYLCRYGTGIQGAIIMGTGAQPAVTLNLCIFLCNIIGLFHGERYHSTFMDKLGFGAYCKKIENPASPLAWLSAREDNVHAYEADDMCGQPFTLNGYKTLSNLIKGAQKQKNLDKMPKNLPLFLIAGGEDPVGHYGKDVLKLNDRFHKMNMQDVTCDILPGLRHEVLNEDSRQEVYEKVYDWAESVILKRNK